MSFFSVPDGIPIGFRCVNKSSSSLSFEWHPPPRNTIHGEFIGYRLRYHKNGNSASLLVLHEREITIGDPEAKVSNAFFKLFQFSKKKKKFKMAIMTPSWNDDSNYSLKKKIMIKKTTTSKRRTPHIELNKKKPPKTSCIHSMFFFVLFTS